MRRSTVQPGEFRQDRAVLVGRIFAVIGALLTARAVMIHLFPPESKSLTSIAQQQYQEELALATSRGNIYDRKKEPLAISVKRPSLVINPKVFRPDRAAIAMLSRLLRMPSQRIVELTKRDRYFAWLKRKVPEDVARRIVGMNLKGLHQVMEASRYYPAGGAAAQLIGFVGSDNSGLSGLERKFDRFLKGPSLTVLRKRDALGRPILLESTEAAPATAGNDIFLTIDLALQEIAEKSLAAGIAKAKAKAGFAIVSDPHTGRILALANSPRFDPNTERHSIDPASANHALMDLFEPGSVLKPFVIAEAMTQKKTAPDSLHYCENGMYHEGNWTIHDDHPQKELTTTDVIVHSSNICAYKIAKLIGPRGLYEALLRFGFTANEFAVDVPGQAFGRIAPYATWKPVRFANIAFGQGLMVTGLELVQGYGALANGGNLLRPYIVDRIEAIGGEVVFANATKILRNVIDPEIARKVRLMLREVVERGTGKSALMAEYTSAGKTGTSEKIDPLTKVYADDKRIASFIGFAPSEDPYLVIYVMVDEPGVKPYYGGTWAAPVFKEIAEKSLHYMNVAPDRETPLKLAEGH